MTDTIQVGDRVKIREGKLACSSFRPFAGRQGYVTRIFSGERFAVAVQIDRACNMVFHRGEIEVVNAGATHA